MPDKKHDTQGKKQEERADDLGRLFRLTDAVDSKLDLLLQRGPWMRGVGGGFGPWSAGLKLGENFNAKKCNPVKITLDKTKCYRVSVVSTDAGGKVDVAWTDDQGTVTNDNGLTAGQQTQCRCKMVKVQVHAQNGDAVCTVVECTP